jgi:hypothetical protein
MNDAISINEGWSNFRKIGFRFFFIFFLLFILPYPINQNPITYIPGINTLLEWYSQAVVWLVQNLGGAIFGIEGEMSTQPTGSGDTTFSWAQNGLYIFFAVIGCIIWSVLDRGRKSYARLWKWFYIIMVYNLAYWMFIYGLIKVFSGQFSAPGIARLLETFGESSPMRIMWTFMGSSETYTHFSGWSETIAGILLLFRRTRTLGALAATGVMFNVFMMNMSFDVPVKLFSFRLMLAGIWIAMADHKRLLSFFLFNKPVQAQNWSPFFKTAWKNYTLLGFQLLIMGWHVYVMASSSIDRRTNFGPNRERPILYGIHDVDLFVINGDTLPPLLTDTVRWKKGFMDLSGFSGDRWGIKMMNDNVRYLSAEIDSINQLLILKPIRDTVNVYEMKYRFEGKNLSLEGVFEGDTLLINTAFFNPDDFLIRSRGFHWINEVPYNRRVPYRK